MCETGDWRAALGRLTRAGRRFAVPRRWSIAIPTSRPPLFLLSFRQRDELAAAVATGGWSPVAARRADLAERRFILSGATIAVVDARGAFDQGSEAVARLADPAEANAAALLTLLSKSDIARVGEMLEAGATHYLASPFGDAEFLEALRFAERYTARLGHSFADDRQAVAPIGPQWRWNRTADEIELEPELRLLLGIEDEGAVAPKRFFDALGDKGGAEARSAIERLDNSDAPTAFAHRLEDGQRLVHHVSRDGNHVCGQVEQPDRAVEPRKRGHRDPLTGLGDAHLARQWIDRRLESPADDGARLILLLIGLHRFDRINSALGRAAGDATLRTIARRIEKLVGPMAGRKRLIARLAGAEFLIGLSSPAGVGEAELLARRLASAIAEPLLLEDRPVRVKMRGGIVTDRGDDADAATLLRRASAALADARGEDGERITIFDSDAERTASYANRLETDLVAALERGEIDILFQPQVAIASQTLNGVEALARWQHPEFGELGADALLTAAERADHLTELSAHIQRKALAMVAAWTPPLDALRIALNVTAAEMAQESFCDDLLARIADSGVPYDRLTVEVTESGLIADLAGASVHLARLRDAGLRVAIDDFGTGYSSLAYLQSLPLDYLKLDRRLSQDIAGGPRERVVISGVIEMARSLGLSVIAEGVETVEQLALLAEEGCEIYQGFLCAPPLDEAALVDLLSEPRC